MRIIDFSKSLLLVLFLCSDKWQSHAFPFHERETEHWLKEEWPHSLLHHNSSASQQWEQRNVSLHSDCLPLPNPLGHFPHGSPLPKQKPDLPHLPTSKHGAMPEALGRWNSSCFSGSENATWEAHQSFCAYHRTERLSPASHLQGAGDGHKL